MKVEEFKIHTGWHDANHYSPTCPMCLLKRLAGIRDLEQKRLELAIRSQHLQIQMAKINFLYGPSPLGKRMTEDFLLYCGGTNEQDPETE